VAKAAGLQYHVIDSGKFRRYGRGIGEITDLRTIGKNARDAAAFLRGNRQAQKLLKELNPDVIFVKGGYVGLPVGLAARRLKIPLIIHESDVIMGLTNRILSRYAEFVATGFPVAAYAEKLHHKLVYTGNVIRQEFYTHSKATKSTPVPTILILGGSTGAQKINQAVWEALPGLTGMAKIIHQTGDQGVQLALAAQAKLIKNQQPRYQPMAFIDEELTTIMTEASLVVSRAGANTLAELAATAQPTILIALPNAANGHQQANAAFVIARGGARSIKQSELTPQRLNQTVRDLLEHTTDRLALSKAIHRLATPQAADKLAKLILQAGQAAA